MDQRAIPQGLLEIRDIRYLLCIVRHGSLRKAAKELYMSESALSQAVKATEKKWGIPLFDRHSHRMVATPALSTLVPHMLSLVQECHRFESAVKALRRPIIETIRLGVVSFARNQVWSGVSRFMKIHGQAVQVEVVEENTYDVVQGVRSGRLDFGVTLWSAHCSGLDAKGITCVPLKQGQLVVVMNRSMKIPDRPITYGHLLRLPVVGFPRGYMIQDLLVETVGPGIEKATIFTSTLKEWQCLPLQLGQAVMVLPDFCVGAVAGDSWPHRVVPLNPPIGIDLVAITAKNSQRSPKAVQLLVLLQEKAGDAPASPS